MENNHSCLMVGLPSAGKTTYLAAFWAIEKEGNTGHKVSCSKYPADTKYLDEQKNKWLSQEKVQRTTLGTEIHLDLKHTETGKCLTLHVPDFKGESFQRLLMNEVEDSIQNWIAQADSIVFFIPYIQSDSLKDEVLGGDENSELVANTNFTINEVSLWTQNIMLLKYLHEKLGSSVPISICFSAWDEIVVETDTESVEEWIKTEHRFFYNFVKSHFDKFKFFGVSAQGKKYEREDAFDEKLDELTHAKKRAYVFTDKKSNDITEPIAFLLEAL